MKRLEPSPGAQPLDLALIGNCRIAALVNPTGRIVWWCFPRFDSDPVFSRLLAGDEESYRYLIESIRRFPPMEAFRAEIAAEYSLRCRSPRPLEPGADTAYRGPVPRNAAPPGRAHARSARGARRLRG